MYKVLLSHIMFFGVVFASSVLTISSHVITSIFTTACNRIPNVILVIYNVSCTHIDIAHYSTFDLNYIFYNKIYIYICMIHVLLILLNSLRFKASVLFGTHTLTDKSLKVLQLTTHLSNLTGYG